MLRWRWLGTLIGASFALIIRAGATTVRCVGGMQPAAGRLQCRGGRTRSLAAGELLVYGGRLGEELLSSGVEEGRLPRLLRRAVQLGRGGRDVLSHSQRKDGARLVRTDPRELRVCV